MGDLDLGNLVAARKVLSITGPDRFPLFHKQGEEGVEKMWISHEYGVGAPLPYVVVTFKGGAVKMYPCHQLFEIELAQEGGSDGE